MAICLKHNQSYSPLTGEFCPYCGNPNKIITDNTKPECVHDFGELHTGGRTCRKCGCIELPQFDGGFTINS